MLSATSTVNKQADSGLLHSGDRMVLIATFVRIVEAGSLSAAALQLGTTQPTVSRRLQLLERSIGMRLIQRSTHGMRLTDDGQRCFNRAKALLADWDAFESDMRGLGEVPEGKLRVVVPHALGQQHLMAPLIDYLRCYPRIDVEWLLRDEPLNFVAQGIDCAIQVGEITDSSMVAIRLSSIQRIVVAAPSLLAGSTLPMEPQALTTLPWLALGTYYRDYIDLHRRGASQVQRVPIQTRFSTNSLYALRTATLDGMGVAVVSAWLVAEDIASARLLHVAPDWSAEPLPVYLVYPRARHDSVRLRRFVEAFRRAMPHTIDG